MINKLISKFHRAVSTYKAQHAKAVVAEYIGLSTLVVEKMLPQVGALYNDVAGVIIDKTAEQPDVAVRLLEALRDAAALYGPALQAAVDAYTAKASTLSEDPAIESKFDAFKDAVDSLTSDVNVG